MRTKKTWKRSWKNCFSFCEFPSNFEICVLSRESSDSCWMMLFYLRDDEIVNYCTLEIELRKSFKKCSSPRLSPIFKCFVFYICSNKHKFLFVFDICNNSFFFFYLRTFGMNLGWISLSSLYIHKKALHEISVLFIKLKLKVLWIFL